MSCQAVTDKLNEMKAELEALALRYEPALHGPVELRSIASLIEQFNDRPDEPMTFDPDYNIHHLIDMVDNAEDALEVYSAIDITISDLHVAGHYGRWSDRTSNSLIEINDLLYHLVARAYDMVGRELSPRELDAYKTDVMEQITNWLG